MNGIQQFFQNNPAFVLLSLSGLLIIFLVWIIVLTFSLKKIREKNKIFFADSKVENIEQLILEQAKSIKILDKDIQELFNISNQINTLAFRGLYKVGLIRFNPFKDVGGDQSFAIALINGKNNGLVLSSLYTREGTRIYSKTTIAGQSEKYPLTEEEKQAIELAMKSESAK